MITLAEFWNDVNLMAAGPMGQRLRYGQIAFNMLNDVRPELAAFVRGTEADPYYCEGTREAEFLEFINYLQGAW